MKNQERQTPIELASADDVKCLLQDAMTASIGNQNVATSASLISTNTEPTTPTTETVTLPTGASMTMTIPISQICSRAALRPAQGAESHTDGVPDEITTEPETLSTVASLLNSLQLEHLIELFDQEQITLEILAEMGHEDLKQVGVSAYGFRHKILKGIAQLRTTTGEFVVCGMFSIVGVIFVGYIKA